MQGFFHLIYWLVVGASVEEIFWRTFGLYDGPQLYLHVLEQVSSWSCSVV